MLAVIENLVSNKQDETNERHGFPVTIDSLSTAKGVIKVLRDDLLPGGTKQRACAPYLRKLASDGVSSVTYASPFAGFAQVALAITAQELNLRCRIFAEQDQTSHTPFAHHPHTHLAKSYGAQIEMTCSLAQAERAAGAAALAGCFKIPLGFNDPRFTQELERACQQIWKPLNQKIKRVWIPVGSGTIARALRKVIPKEVSFNLVDVGVLDARDIRIESLKNLENTALFKAPELFSAKNEISAPIASNVHYDAKLWRFISEHGTEGDLWWNVAR